MERGKRINPYVYLFPFKTVVRKVILFGFFILFSWGKELSVKDNHQKRSQQTIQNWILGAQKQYQKQYKVKNIFTLFLFSWKGTSTGMESKLLKMKGRQQIFSDPSWFWNRCNCFHFNVGLNSLYPLFRFQKLLFYEDVYNLYFLLFAHCRMWYSGLLVFMCLSNFMCMDNLLDWK